MVAHVADGQCLEHALDEMGEDFGGVGQVEIYLFACLPDHDSVGAVKVLQLLADFKVGFHSVSSSVFGSSDDVMVYTQSS